MLVFGQQHATTGPWFQEIYGQAHSIPVSDFPHARALAGDHAIYLEYLRVSWEYYGRENTPTTRRAQLERLLSGQPGPVKAVQRPNGDWLVVDGNHRAAVSYAAGIEPEIIEVASDRWLAHVTTNRGERYGSKPGRPYQSVFHHGREWVVGRRRDTLMRHQLIDDYGDGVALDLGCNIGAATMLNGGHGVDASPKIITTAWRLAGFFASPATFQVANLNEETHLGEVVFCFAVLAHLNTLTAIRETLGKARVVYFEENAGRAQLGKVVDLFRHVEELPAPNRRLFRCLP